MYHIYRNLIGFFIVFVQFSSIAQTQDIIVNGQILNDLNEHLSFANITVVNDQTNIITYAVSNINGTFQLRIPHKSITSNIWLEVSYLGYIKQRKAFDPKISTYQFVLQPDATVLSEVVIKNRPILKRLGDTLSYRVMSFAKPEDRSIGDVLNRMPGIDVAADGIIYYNGKKIENLYIHGDDLMSGRYGLASKTIKKEDIVSIEVIKNHQPIKVLENKIQSDKTAVNLVLKDENSLKLSAKASVGVGLPELYNISITPVLLSKKIKMINVIALNNNGVDYKNDLQQLGASNFISDINTVSTNFSLSLATVGPPDVPLSSYYFNNSKLINLNNLYNTKSGVQLKFNIQGFIDKNKMDYNSYVENYTSNDTLVYNEEQALRNKAMLLYTSFNMMTNKKSYFFNNNLKVNISKDNDNAYMNFNTSAFPQTLDKDFYEISNDVNWMPQLKGKGIGEFRWLLNYKNNDQNLNINDGYYSEIHGHEGFYDRVNQSLQMPKLFSNAYISYKIPNRVLNQDYKLGYINESQKLKSSLNFIDNQQSNPYLGDVGNDLKWNKQNIYFSSEYQIKRNKIELTAFLPFSYQFIQYDQENYNLNSKSSNFIFNPNLNFKYNFNVEERIEAGYSFNTQYDNITDIYRGAILQNYRTLIANNTNIQKKDISSYKLNYAFEKSISLFFVNAGLTYNKINANTILSSNITDNIQTTVALPFENVQNNLRLSLGLSKYSFALKSTFSINSHLSSNTFQQIINDELVPFQSRAYALNFKFNKKLFDAIKLNYEPHSFWSQSKLDINNDNIPKVSYKTFRLDQNLKIGVTPIKSWDVEIDAKHSLTQHNDNDVYYFFCDMNIRHRFKKSAIDLSFNIQNLFDVKVYKLYNIMSNQLIMNTYQLRGRMILLNLEWYF